MTAEMWAAYIESRGAPSEIIYGRLPIPEPGPTDVLVRVEATAVNPVDTYVRSGAYDTPLPFPFVIGRDLAGTVVRAGAGAAGFKVGQRVWANSLGHGGRQGAACEYAVVAADRLYPLPAGADVAATVALAHPAATAYLALFTHAGLQPGETVFVGGGAGHVARAAIVLAGRAGAHVVTTASAADLGTCRALGAQTAIDYRAPDAADRLRTALPAGADVHLDTSGQHDLDLAVELLAPRGRVVLMSGMTAHPPLPVGKLYTRDASILGFAISNARIADLAAAATRINALVRDGVLHAGAVEELPLSAAAVAHERLEAGATRGVRLVLRPTA